MDCGGGNSTRAGTSSAWAGVVLVPLALAALLGSAGAPLVFILLTIGFYSMALIFAGPRLLPQMWSAIGRNNLLAFGVMLGKIACLVGAGAWLLNCDEQSQVNALLTAVIVNLIVCRGEYRDTIVASDQAAPDAE